MSTVGWKGSGHLALEFPAGVDASGGVDAAPTGRMRFRYNDVTKQPEVSVSGGAYVSLGTGSSGGWADNQILRGDNAFGIQGGIATENDAGMFTIGPVDPAGGLRIRFPSDDAVLSNYVAVGSTANFTAPNNRHLHVGWNADSGGGKVVAGEPAWQYVLESGFEPAPAAALLCEQYVQYTSVAGINRRPISSSVNRSTDAAAVQLSGQITAINSVGTIQRLSLIDAAAGDTALSIGQNPNATSLRFEVNNKPLILCVNAALGAYIELMRLNANNDLLLGNSCDTNVPAGRQLRLGAGVKNASASLQMDSGTTGFLPPRMTTTQKNAIVSPATGLVVYDTSLNKLCVFTGAAWETVTSA